MSRGSLLRDANRDGVFSATRNGAMIVIDRQHSITCQVCVKDCVVKVLWKGGDGFHEVRAGISNIA